MQGLQISCLSKSFGTNQVLHDIDFQVSEGEIVVLLGPSGCGKSTLLSIIAGLEPPDQGELRWNGASLQGIPAHRRGFGLMFQEHVLFPHRNVFENIAFGLQMARWPKDRIEQRVEEVLSLVGLPGFERREIHTLSGGEGQRVALARALAAYPRMLMLDEPLGSLDRNLRERLVFDLRTILKESSQTALYVTHDHEEAYIIADRIIVMNTLGWIEQIGTPQAIYQFPVSVFVAKFLGFTNLLPGTAIKEPSGTWVETPIGRFPAQNETQGPVNVLLRPDRVYLADSGNKVGTSESQINGEVKEISFRGQTCQAVIVVDHQRLVFQFPSNVRLPHPGEQIHLRFDPQQAILLYPAEEHAS